MTETKRNPDGSWPSEAPTLSDTDNVLGAMYTHPAFGAVTVTRFQSTGMRLFGSDLLHNSGVNVSIHLAKLAQRDGYAQHFTGPTLVEFSLSEVQWAALVSSFGDGSGTPVTLSRYVTVQDGLVHPPYIAPFEDSAQEKAEKNLERLTRKALQRMDAAIKTMETMVDEGKMSKATVRDSLRSLRIALGNLPSDVEFAHTVFTEQVEKAVQKAKAELEAYTYHHWERRGGVPAVENSSTDTKEIPQ